MSNHYPPNTDEYLANKDAKESGEVATESEKKTVKKSLIERAADHVVDYIVLEMPNAIKNTWKFEVKPSLKMMAIRAVNVFLGNSLGFTVTPNGSSSPEAEEWRKYHGGMGTTVSSASVNGVTQTTVRHSSAGRPDGGYFVYDDLSYDDYGKARAVLDDMTFRLGRYGKVRVSEMYEISGKSALAMYTDEAFGWKTLENAHPYVKLDGRYGLHLPKPEQIPVNP